MSSEATRKSLVRKSRGSLIRRLSRRMRLLELNVKQKHREQATVDRSDQPFLSRAISDVEVANYVSQVDSLDEEQEKRGIKGIRKLLSSTTTPPVERVTRAGLLPQLVQLLGRDDDQELQFEAAWCLTNCAGGSPSTTQSIVDLGAVELLVEMLYYSDMRLREQAAWALGNIIGESVELRDIVLRHGALQALLSSIQPNVDVPDRVVFTVGNLFRVSPLPSLMSIQKALPVLVALLVSEREAQVIDVAWSISTLCKSDDTTLRALSDVPAVAENLITCLEDHTQLDLVFPVLEAIRILTRDALDSRWIMLEDRLLHATAQFIPCPHQDVASEACQIVYQVASFHPESISRILDTDIVEYLLAKLLPSSRNFGVLTTRLHALKAFNAMACGTLEQVQELVHRGCVQVFLYELKEDADANALETSLVLDVLARVYQCGCEIAHTTGRNPFEEVLFEFDVRHTEVTPSKLGMRRPR
mmetsp:Transcript_21498/g.37993  ORF Transcript_21498/g.37993 Transcript_21498/m.37993 type:complete len:473 (+) Transcript_21498:287-1705(+)